MKLFAGTALLNDLRGTGRRLGGLAVGIGMFSLPMVICFGKSGKSAFPQISNISDSILFLGILCTPRFTDHSGMRLVAT